ncbi:MAG TPA: hydroxymethylglutaryl-CoA lyase [Chitinophagaceae bacterium]|nr:hydroxymethylglutaryl-CoA lyase [Chitinophagaceae bacterium]HPH30866.1 hydroxymethylglutaryl-CoA lyase [Chitinophagaceae bacterium]HPN58766.1 hydroxymethylglutaryl-CoA lyase [Chitinophagaceae bacterium]
MISNQVRLIECPRDAMQGWKTPIPATQKAAYINLLLKAGFDTIDFGSFVSPKAIPQLADTREVIGQLDLSGTSTRLLAIVANLRGATDAVVFDEISYLGYPFSVSETFQQRNTNSTIRESLTRVEEIQEICVKSGKQLVIYISMGFGNPYGDPYDEEQVFEWVNRLVGMDIGIISLADTVGLASPEQVYSMTRYLVESLPGTEIGVHLHSTPDNWREKLDAAVKAGCLRFDGALKGIGGCPMANDELVGNMDSERMIEYFRERNLLPDMDPVILNACTQMAAELFKH